MAPTNRLLALELPAEGVEASEHLDPSYDGYALSPADLMYQREVPSRRQEPQMGRLPTIDERAKANVMPPWQVRAMDDLRDRAAQSARGQPWLGDREHWYSPPAAGSVAQEWLGHLGTATMGARGGYHGGSFKESPDPYLLPGGGWQGTQPLVLVPPKGTPLDGMTIPQNMLSVLGPLQDRPKPLGEGATGMRFADSPEQGRGDADPRAFIKDIDKLGTYTPGQRESEHVESGKPMPPWDEFMANLGALLTGYGNPARETEEQQLSHINSPSEVKRIMGAYRNWMSAPRAGDPMLPGPRETPEQ